jgi:hypothetical protein
MTDATLARALDLTRAVTDILNKSGAIGGLVGQVVKWLAREGIPEGEFAFCLQKSKALIFPNDNGLKIRTRLRESDAKLKAKPYVAGLKLVSTLSIGRWMINDPDYCYLVTTVAALFTHHDMEYTSEVVCDMLLDESNREEETRLFYSYEKHRLLPVVTRIVESITLNVVNCSGILDKIPAELLGKCSHHIDSHTFATAAIAIFQSHSDVIIRCNRFLADLYLWLLAHIEGEISVSIAGKIIHRVSFGRPLRSVTMLADEACSEEYHEMTFTSTLAVSTNVGGTLRTMLRHTDGREKQSICCTNIRQPLYDLVGYNRADRADRALTPQESREIRIAGQQIVWWLVTRPTIADHDSRVVYRTQLDDDHIHPSSLTVDTLLSRWPAICNEDFGLGMPGCRIDLQNNLDKDNRLEAEPMAIGCILNCFPHARAIILHACRRCWCTSCTGWKPGYQPIYRKPGCLAYLVESHLCLILSHAVADGFGIPDASNLGDFRVVRNGVQKLMSELISRKRIAWGTWFSLAACIYLGCEWPEATAISSADTAELVAVQHGSEVVVAPWVELQRGQASRGSFGCLVATGQLCDMETGFGVLYTEETSPPAGTISDWKLPESRSMTADIPAISLQTAITVLEESIFKLTTIVKLGHYLRIVNPATVVVALDRSWVPKCNDLFHGAPAQNHQMWSAEDALGLWGEGDLKLPIAPTEPWVIVDTSPHLTTKKSDSARLNLFMALSPHGCVLKPESCCLTCAIAQGYDRLLPPVGRRIIRVM